MAKQIIYPVYSGFIILYACIFVTIGVFFAKLLDKIFPRFDPKKPKSKVVIYIEVLLQIASIVFITYVFREYTHYFIESFDYLKKNSYGSPDKFATIIIAPTMFAVQPSLINKIEYLANIK
mgnify:CR=1 FL=1